MSKNTKIIKILREAREVLKTGGWIQHEYSNTKGQHCALGAVDAVLDINRAEDSSVWILRGKIKRILGEAVGTHSVISYNDMPGRTADEVINMFNVAIRNLKEGVA